MLQVHWSLRVVFFSLQTHFFVKQADLQLHFVSMVTVFENATSSSMTKSLSSITLIVVSKSSPWLSGLNIKPWYVMKVMWVGVEGFTLKNFVETLWRTFNKASQILTGETIFSDVKSNFNLSPNWKIVTALSWEIFIQNQPTEVFREIHKKTAVPESLF